MHIYREEFFFPPSLLPPSAVFSFSDPLSDFDPKTVLWCLYSLSLIPSVSLTVPSLSSACVRSSMSEYEPPVTTPHLQTGMPLNNTSLWSFHSSLSTSSPTTEILKSPKFSLHVAWPPAFLPDPLVEHLTENRGRKKLAPFSHFPLLVKATT